MTCTRITITAAHAKNSHDSINKTPLRNPLSREEVSRLLTPMALSYRLRGELTVQSAGVAICYEQYGVEDDTRYLKFLFDLMTDLAKNYRHVLAWGGEAVPALQEIAANSGHVLHAVAVHLLRDIGADTRQRLEYRAGLLYCPRCLTHYEERKIKLSWWQSMIYIGCRACGQSRQGLSGEHLVVRLDQEIDLETYKKNGDLHVNWLERRHMFDFDRVEIIRASDEDVERFAVQAGNDTDSFRKPRYEKMRCVVSPECRLSQNTIRILQRMFGEVVTRNQVEA